MPYYVAKHLGASAVEVGTLYTASFLASAVTLLAGGVLADRYDRKKVILVGWLSWLPAPLLFSLAEDWGQMLIGMVLWGFWLSGPAYTAYVLSSTSSDRLATTFATLSSSWSLGYAFSPAVGGALAEALGIKAVFYAAFTLYAASCLMLAPISSQPPPRPLREGCVFKDMFKSKGFLALLALFSSISFINSMFHQLIPVFLTEAYSYTSFQVGLVGSASFIGSATLGVALGRLGDKYGRRYALTTSLLLCSSSLALLMLTGSLYVLLAAALLLGASYATWPLMSATVGPLAPRHARARWMSISQAVTMLSSFPAPYVGGLIYKGSPYALFAASMAALLSISLLLLGPLRKHVEQEAPQRWAAAL